MAKAAETHMEMHSAINGGVSIERECLLTPCFSMGEKNKKKHQGL